MSSFECRECGFVGDLTKEEIKRHVTMCLKIKDLRKENNEVLKVYRYVCSKLTDMEIEDELIPKLRRRLR